MFLLSKRKLQEWGSPKTLNFNLLPLSWAFAKINFVILIH